LPQIINADTARLEIYSIETLTLTDQQFLLGARDGAPVRIGAELRLPPGTARIPAVLLIHGSGGVGANVDGWAQALNAMGIAAFILDTFTGRGISQTITDQSQLSSFSMIVDAYKGLELLSQHPRIHPERIAVMGFSKGGFASLYSSMKRIQRLWCAPGIEFAAGKDVQLTVYEGARHAFDNPLYPSVLVLPDAVLTTNCRREEKQPGNIINLDTGKTFTWNDACVTRGATVGFDPHARVQAIKTVSEFLRAQWNLNSYYS
jgi:dienelactone hydrolase